MRSWYAFFVIIIIISCLSPGDSIQRFSARNRKDIELEFNWNYAELENPPENEFIADGVPSYIPGNNIIYGVAYDPFFDVLYASVPRSAVGVPATLLMLKNASRGHDLNPLFTPFPVPEVNSLRKCDLRIKSPPKFVVKKRKVTNHPQPPRHQLDYSFDERYDIRLALRNSQCGSNERLISTFEPVLDKCGRLWVIDTGVLESNGDEDNDPDDFVVKAPQLWVFSVRNGPDRVKLIRRFDFPKSVVNDAKGFSGLAVDVINDKCEETFAYIPNQIDGRIVVYDFFKHVAWFFENYSFAPDASESDFYYDGFETHFEAGISSIALGPEEEGPGHYRRVFYIAGSSTGEYSLSTRSLRDQKKAPKVHGVQLVGFRGKDSQAMTHVFDEESGVLFFAESQSGRVRCWNSKTPLRPENVETIFESRKFVYGSSISIDESGFLWFLSNSYPLFKAHLYSYLGKDIRLFKVRVKDAIAGTACEPPREVPVTLTQDNIREFFNVTQVIYN